LRRRRFVFAVFKELECDRDLDHFPRASRIIPDLIAIDFSLHPTLGIAHGRTLRLPAAERAKAKTKENSKKRSADRFRQSPAIRSPFSSAHNYFDCFSINCIRHIHSLDFGHCEVVRRRRGVHKIASHDEPQCDISISHITKQ
jgi:hypothetical protein